MNRKLWLSGLMALSLCGCGTMNNTTAGAVGGGALGAGVGALAGAAVGRPLQGAAIGAGVGGLTGAAIGNGEDRAEKRQAQAAAAYAAAHPPVAINDIVQMTQQHLSEGLILNQIRTTNSYFNLTAADITYLREQGVGEHVILEMQNRRGPAPVVVQPRGYVVVDPPPPPVGVGVGVTYIGGGRRW